MEEYTERPQIWLRMKDSAYEERLYHFLTYHYGNRMEVHRYEEYREGLKPRADSLILTDEEGGTEAFGKRIPLTAGGEEGISLYQSGHKIAGQLLEKSCPGEVSGPLTPAGSPPEPGRGKLLSVYSPVGGCGKSVFARALAECLYAETGGRVLYLSLEGASEWRLFYRAEKTYNLSDLLYGLLLNMGQRDKIPDLLERVLCRQESGIYFIQPCTSFEDLNLLTPGETEELITILQENFEWIICDMNTAFHSVNRSFIQQSRRCFLLSAAGREAQAKLEDFFQGLEIYGELCQQIKEKTLLLRRGRLKEERGEYSLPEERDLFSDRDKLLRYNTRSAYYQRVREIAGEESRRAGS